MNRQEAEKLLKEYNNEEFHLRHAYTVEGVMKYFAKELGEDEEYWGIVGLLHDVDYEKYPEEHCKKAREILKNAGVDMTSPEPIEQACEVFEQKLDAFEKLMKA